MKTRRTKTRIIGCPGGWRTGGSVADAEVEGDASTTAALALMFWVGFGTGAMLPT